MHLSQSKSGFETTVDLSILKRYSRLLKIVYSPLSNGNFKRVHLYLFGGENEEDKCQKLATVTKLKDLRY